jgi:hypothetical protein
LAVEKHAKIAIRKALGVSVGDVLLFEEDRPA